MRQEGGDSGRAGRVASRECEGLWGFNERLSKVRKALLNLDVVLGLARWEPRGAIQRLSWL